MNALFENVCFLIQFFKSTILSSLQIEHYLEDNSFTVVTSHHSLLSIVISVKEKNIKWTDRMVRKASKVAITCILKNAMIKSCHALGLSKNDQYKGKICGGRTLTAT